MCLPAMPSTCESNTSQISDTAPHSNIVPFTSKRIVFLASQMVTDLLLHLCKLLDLELDLEEAPDFRLGLEDLLSADRDVSTCGNVLESCELNFGTLPGTSLQGPCFLAYEEPKKSSSSK
mmetsp:Transcript_44878/g.106494  ORF Transcript_44878/g.106494 Transcript_44878/m.106494 type:complete len:120 (-) Transcript_44878:189-548(-)